MPTSLTAPMEQELTRTLEVVCERAGIDPTGARLVKFTINAV